MTQRYIFTVTAGRSGQSSLAHLLNTHVKDCYAAFEEPTPTLYFKGFAGDIERRLRRRFLETHELLGRGKVLSAFDEGNEAYLDRIAAKRLAIIDKKGTGIHVDVSKYFARGLHRAFCRARPDPGLILLVRDPVLNMRSFLNRDKMFTLDNNMPNSRSNLLPLPCNDFHKGEFYLWAWCEMFLRYLAIIDEFKIQTTTVIRTEDLNDAEKMHVHFDALNLPHDTIRLVRPLNTNAGQGKRETIVREVDVKLFESFLERLPYSTIKQITYFNDYDPRSIWLD